MELLVELCCCDFLVKYKLVAVAFYGYDFKKIEVYCNLHFLYFWNILVEILQYFLNILVEVTKYMSIIF